MHALHIMLVELNNLHNIVHRTTQSKILAMHMTYDVTTNVPVYTG